MSGWGIADTAPKIEKIKAESADYLHGLDSCGKIEWSTYSDMFDFYADLIEKAYAQGKEDAQPEIVTDCHDLTGDLLSRKLLLMRSIKTVAIHEGFLMQLKRCHPHSPKLSIVSFANTGKTITCVNV